MDKPHNVTCLPRIRRLRKAMRQAGLDTLMVSIQENRRYLSGFTGEDTQFDETAGALFIAEDRLILATDSRYETQARFEAPLFEVFCYREGLAKALPEILNLLKTERLGFESVRLCVREFQKIQSLLKKEKPRVELVPSEDLVENSRRIKSASEIRAIQKALGLAEQAFLSIAKDLKPGITEKEAAWALEKEMRNAGADGLSFPVIAAFGKNSALPHAVPGSRRLKSGEPLLFDWGLRLDGYCSDISRSFYIGRPDARFRKVFRAVRDAQEKAAEAIRPGASTRDIDRIARSLIHRRGFKDFFGHGLGHGVGLSIHESPRIGPSSDAELAPGMVFTLEPGIYLPEWGGVRLENMVVVKKDRVEILNRLPTDMRLPASG